MRAANVALKAVIFGNAMRLLRHTDNGHVRTGMSRLRSLTFCDLLAGTFVDMEVRPRRCTALYCIVLLCTALYCPRLTGTGPALPRQRRVHAWASCSHRAGCLTIGEQLTGRAAAVTGACGALGCAVCATGGAGELV